MLTLSHVTYPPDIHATVRAFNTLICKRAACLSRQGLPIKGDPLIEDCKKRKAATIRNARGIVYHLRVAL